MGHTLVLNTSAQPISTLPLSSLNWQDAVKALYLGNVSVVAVYDNWTIHSPSSEIQVPSVVMVREWVKLHQFVGYSDEMVFLRDGYRCQYCGGRFRSKELTMDHVVPKSMGGKLIFSNVVSACGPCNNKRGNDIRIQPRNAPYRPTHQELNAKRRLYPVDVPHWTWIDFINWSSPDLVHIDEPKDMPGYRQHDNQITVTDPVVDDHLRNLLTMQSHG